MASKYRNVRTFYKGKTYDSKKESVYRASLDMLKKAKNPQYRVVSIEEQVPYKLEVNGVSIGKYVLDFKVEYADGHTEYIDVKSAMTAKLPVYRMKKKLMLALYGIEILEK